MTRRLAAGALAAVAALAFATSASASPSVPTPGGACDGVVDVACRGHVCQPEELDCGMIPPCILWTAVTSGCVL